MCTSSVIYICFSHSMYKWENDLIYLYLAWARDFIHCLKKSFGFKNHIVLSNRKCIVTIYQKQKRGKMQLYPHSFDYFAHNTISSSYITHIDYFIQYVTTAYACSNFSHAKFTHKKASFTKISILYSKQFQKWSSLEESMHWKREKFYTASQR